MVSARVLEAMAIDANAVAIHSLPSDKLGYGRIGADAESLQSLAGERRVMAATQAPIMMHSMLARWTNPGRALKAIRVEPSAIPAVPLVKFTTRQESQCRQR